MLCNLNIFATTINSIFTIFMFYNVEQFNHVLLNEFWNENKTFLIQLGNIVVMMMNSFAWIGLTSFICCILCEAHTHTHTQEINQFWNKLNMIKYLYIEFITWQSMQFIHFACDRSWRRKLIMTHIIIRYVFNSFLPQQTFIRYDMAERNLCYIRRISNHTYK